MITKFYETAAIAITAVTLFSIAAMEVFAAAEQPLAIIRAGLSVG